MTLSLNIIVVLCIFLSFQIDTHKREATSQHTVAWTSYDDGCHMYLLFSLVHIKKITKQANNLPGEKHCYTLDLN